MKCPFCELKGSKVLESRPLDAAVYRRRSCRGCGKNWVTQEVSTSGLKMPSEVRNAYARKGEPDPSKAQIIDTGPQGNGAHLQGIWG
jgi:hypothetical protein